MKNLTRKLMLSIVAIALVVIALGTSTFAWFTLSNRASVGQFNAEVTAGEGMELSLDGTTWYSNIPADVIQAKIQEKFNALPVGNLNNAGEPVLGAVTTATLTDTAFLKMDLSGSGAYVSAVANVDFISLKIYVKAVDINKISVDTIELTGQDMDWTADATFTHANGAEITQNSVYKMSAKNAARVGIHGTNDFVYQLPAVGGASAPTLNSSNTILDGTALPLKGTPADKTAMYNEATNGQEKYFVEKTNGIYMRGFTDYPESVIKADTDAALGVDVLTLTEDGDYYTGSFDLYVWFEGFDPDTYDAVLKMPLSVKLSLKGTLDTP